MKRIKFKGLDSCKKCLLVSISLFLLIIVSSFAGDRCWTPIGPYTQFSGGPSIYNVIIDPTDSNIIYGSEPYGGGAYKSIDGGATWLWSNIGVYNNSLDHDFHEIAIDPSNPQILYAGFGENGGGIYKSINGGFSWKRMVTGSGYIWGIWSIAVDPTNSQTVYAGGDLGHIYITNDGGVSWQRSSTAIGSYVTGIEIHPYNSSIIYAATGGNLCKSIDYGKTWTQLTAGNFGDMAINPLDPNILYTGQIISPGYGVFKSIDAGLSWTRYTTGLDKQMIYTVAVDPVSTNNIYAGWNGIFKSIDGGITWNLKTTADDFYCGSFAIDPKSPQTIYAAIEALSPSKDGVYKSLDGGETWLWSMDSILRFITINALAISPINSEILYAGTESGVFKTTSNITTWIPITIGLGNQSINAIAIDNKVPSIIYAGTNSEIYKTLDDGTTWSFMTIGIGNRSIYTLAIDPLETSIVYAGADTSIFRSSNGGITWNQMTTGIDEQLIRSIIINPINSNIVYASNGGYIYQSIDRGITWSNITALPSGEIYCLAMDSTQPNIIYVGSYLGVFTSLDAGTTWSWSSGLGNRRTYVLAIDSFHPQTIYAGTDSGIYKTDDRGNSWASMNNGIYYANIKSLVIANTSIPIIYCGGVQTGIWEFTTHPTAVEPRFWQELF
jgi:photosystem II stability/assembly factor-like uncharacterized protein